MSASDSIGYFVELGEYNLIIARATLSPRPRVIDSVQEVWLGDAAAVDAALEAVKPAGTSANAVALLRLKGHGTFLSDAGQTQSVNNAAAVEGFISSQLGGENTPTNWAWCNASNGQAQQSGSRWMLDAIPTSATNEAIAKLRGWSFELARCQSAPLTLAGGIVTAARSTSVLLVEISDTRTFLFTLSGQGVTASATIAVGFDALAGATQTALGLKFRGSAARLMFNDSYDFAEAAMKVVEPLANAIRDALPGLGNPTQIVAAGVLARQTWITQSLAGALNLAPFTFDAATWAGGQSLAFTGGADVGKIAPSWLGVLNAVATYDAANPAASKPWNVLLSGAPVATPPAVIVPPAPPKPVEIPAIIMNPPKPAAAIPPAPAKPATVPVLFQDPPKPAAPTAPAKPATPPPPPPKPAVIITPPAKPAEPAKPAIPATPATPAKPATPPAPTPAIIRPADPKAGAKPAEPVKPAPAKPAPAPVPAAKAPAKPEPAKPNPSLAAKPAPVGAVKSATAAPFPPKRNNTPLIIGIAAVLILGLGGFFIYGMQKKEAAAKAAAIEQKQRLEQEANRAREAEARARELEAQRKQAEEDARRQAIAAENARLQAAAETARSTTERLLSARGSFTIATQPAGATVVVGELAPRISPFSLRDLRLGFYTVTISLPGYDTEQRNVEIKENENIDLGTVVLKRQIGTIEVNSDPERLAYEIKPAGALFVNPDDVRTGQTPATVSNLPIGSYQVTVNRPNWAPHVSTVAVERNRTVKIQSTFAGGSVVLTSTPSGATVLRDNQTPIGVTPLTINDLSPGPVSYTLTYLGCDPVTVTGRVEGGKPLTLNATLLDSERIMRLSELDERPAPISQADPELTTAMQIAGGSATISFVVERDGVPSELSVEQASSPAFGRVCQIAVTKWRFKPGMIRGKPVKTRVTIPFKIAPQS